MDFESHLALRRPPPLPRGGHIRVVAPASSFPADAFEQGVRLLRLQGYRVSWREDIFQRDYYLAGSVARRVDELHEAFADPDIDAIFCARGGYGCMQLLPKLDLDLLKNHPKIFVGCSDLTPLLNLCVQRLGFLAFHGPMVAGLKRTNAECLWVLFELLEGKLIPNFRAPYSAQPNPYGLDAAGAAIMDHEITAPLCGGNLSMIAATLGTPAELDTRGRILCLEDVGERPYRLDRLLTQLKLAGKLKDVAGVAFGTFTDCEEPGGEGLPSWKLVMRTVSELDCPVLIGLPFGHGPVNYCLPLGALATMQLEGSLNILGPVVQSPRAS